ncbi:MAG: PrsW family glutamic-type intramembrane protease [Candidatus Absconditicoccaceae bacterium]
MVGFLFIYKYVLGYLGLNNMYFAEILNLKSMAIFIIYCGFFLIINSLFYKNINRKSILQSIALGIILFLGIGYGGYLTGLTVVLMYYFLAAYAEEIIKFTAGENIFLKEGRNNSDLIFFCILIGLAFAIVENIFYLGSNILNQEINLIGLSLGRGIISSMIHVVTTGIVAYLAMKGLNKKLKIPLIGGQVGFILFVFIGIILGFGVHLIYNLSLFYNRNFITIPLIIIGYFILSFLMFKSDKIYIKNI